MALTVRARAPRRVGAARVRLALPAGWHGDDSARLGRLTQRRDATATLRLTAPADPSPGRVRIPATLRAGGRSGTSSALVRVAPAVQGTLQPLPQVADFRTWVVQAGVPQLDSLVNPVAALGSGQTRDVQVDLRNFAAQAESGSVALRLPPGFTADAAAKAFAPIPPGATASVTFQVTNTDPALKTSNEGGDYGFDIVTTAGGAESSERAALNLVPVTTVPQATAAPLIDGVESPGEYGGPALDLSRVWEGDKPSGPLDASGTAKAAWSGDALYVFVDVADDVLGTVLPQSDAKRHWRTDSVELAIDPRGDSENTSTTFKVGVFPTTQEGGPAAYRDADNHQGAVAETAPGFAVASQVSAPYRGYTLEMKVPFADLPAAAAGTGRAQPVHLRLRHAGQDRPDAAGLVDLGGVQGDPYRWGRATLDGYTPPPAPGRAARSDLPARGRAVGRLAAVDRPGGARRRRPGGGPQAVDGIRIVRAPRLLGDGALPCGCARRAPASRTSTPSTPTGARWVRGGSSSRARAGPT